jgi:hypothetical protein
MDRRFQVGGGLDGNETFCTLDGIDSRIKTENSEGIGLLLPRFS